MRASLATNQGRQLMPMGENGSGTFFMPCAHNDEGPKRNRIKQTRNATSEGFCEEWSQKSKGHVWFPLSNLPLLRRLGLYRRRLMLSISVGRYTPSKTTLPGTRFCHLYFRGSSFQSQGVALNRDCKCNRVSEKNKS